MVGLTLSEKKMKRKAFMVQKTKQPDGFGGYPHYTEIIVFGDSEPELPKDSTLTDRVVQPDARLCQLGLSDIQEASDEYFDLGSRIAKHQEELDALIAARREIKSAIDSLVYEHGDLSVDGVVFACVDESIVVLKPKKI